MNKITTFLRNLMNDESGQGTAEYILLLVIAVSLVLMFKTPIMQAVQDRVNDIKGGMSSITTSPSP
jgi:Flp pilus assembly pilin Flp